ncbi:phospholipase D-like domain-containing protein [Streptomyces mirabilis]|uniref:phospholipase D-like domain-containing protein n=1 Tax=Streptomyces mirabilis TaxID=68239 RepID=UPI00367AF1F9
MLARHVEVTGIDDETTFFSTFEDEIRKARPSVWLWAPWVANRVRGILPLLHEAAGRGVRVTVFIRDDTDQLQARPDSQSLIVDLRGVVHTVVPVNVMHQKIAVIDERTVMIGSQHPVPVGDPRGHGDDARRPLRPQAPGARARRAVHPPAEVRPLRRHEHRAAPPHERRLVLALPRHGLQDGAERPEQRQEPGHQGGWGQELRDRTMLTPAQDS